MPRLTPDQRQHLITEAAFVRDYAPRVKPNGDLFEFEDVEQLPRNTVWTIVDDGGETDCLFASPGFHVVNKLGYIVTAKPWADDTLDALWHDADDGDLLTVHGSHGDIEIDAQGHVTSLLEPDHEYAPIQRFDLAEYAQAYPAEPTPGDFDILDLGYWTVGGGYVAAEPDFRAEVARHAPERALDWLADLCESFLAHWENDDDDAERRLAAKARKRYEVQVAVLRAKVTPA
jgi:hypothetical protein